MVREVDVKKDIKHPDYLEGALLLVDKPKTWTSFDVVNKIRFALRGFTGVKKIKVGHAGTLDPLATGLLLIGTGKMTKKLQDLQGLDKFYEGTFKFGATTASLDAETPEEKQCEIDHINLEILQKQAHAFLGEQDQIPPMYSAIKKDGQPLYKKARKGIMVEVKPRKINIKEIAISDYEAPFATFKCLCSKGTYIRSLARDFGLALDAQAYLSSLVRTQIGQYNLEDAWQLDALIASLNEGKT